VLLGCSPRQVGEARVRAFAQLTASLEAGSNHQAQVEQFQESHQ
jgi:hypothetical protein